MDFIYLSISVLNCSNYQVVSTFSSEDVLLKADFISGVNVKYLADVQTKTFVTFSLFLSYVTIHPSITLHLLSMRGKGGGELETMPIYLFGS